MQFYELVDAEREGSISEAERAELDAYLSIEHLMRVVKAEAHRRQIWQISHRIVRLEVIDWGRPFDQRASARRRCER
jgi:hypothetical protein